MNDLRTSTINNIVMMFFQVPGRSLHGKQNRGGGGDSHTARGVSQPEGL